MKIGKYEILGEVGKGAMATVYRARDPVLDRVVALKTLFASVLREPDSRDRFLREARSVARLQHRNIITVYELGEVDGMPYISMEYLEGANLHTAAARGDLAGIRAKLEVTEQLCLGLSYAHRRGVVHRDVKPSNVIVLPDGTAKLLDFGIAHLEGSTFATSTGQLLGTPNYMAPEQFEDVTVDHRVDMWAVGVILYELVTGRRPFEAATLAPLIYRIVNGRLPEIDPVRYEVPPAVVALIERALAKNPDERFPDLEVMGREVRKILDGERSAAPTSRIETGGPQTPARPVPALRIGPGSFRELVVFGDASPLGALSFSRDEALLAVGGVDGSMRLWDPATRMKLRTLRSRTHLRTGYAARTTALAFSPDGKLLAAGHLDGSIYVWDPETGLETEVTLRHEGAIGGLAFLPDGKVLVSGAADATLKLWEIPALLAGEARRMMRRQPAAVTALTLTPDGTLIITGHVNNSLRVHDPATGRLAATLHGHHAAPSALAVSPDGRVVASGARDGSVRLHTLATRELGRTFEGHNKTVSSLRFFPGGRQLVSAAMDGVLLIWDTDRETPLTAIEGGPGEAFACLALTQNPPRLTSGLADGRLRVWQIAG